MGIIIIIIIKSHYHGHFNLASVTQFWMAKDMEKKKDIREKKILLSASEEYRFNSISADQYLNMRNKKW